MQTAHGAEPVIQLKVVGGLAGVSQYKKFEEPFWTHEVTRLTGGRVQAEIHPFDRSGLPGQEMLQLMRLGVMHHRYGAVSAGVGERAGTERS